MINIIQLPKIIKNDLMALDESLEKRKSIRKFNDKKLSLECISQILWYANLVPCAGGIHSVHLGIFSNKINNKYNFFSYDKELHHLYGYENMNIYNILDEITPQDFLKNSFAIVVFLSSLDKLYKKYHDDALVYHAMEVGHISQNIYLQCTSLNIGTCSVAAFNKREVRNLFFNKDFVFPNLLMPIGYYD